MNVIMVKGSNQSIRCSADAISHFEKKGYELRDDFKLKLGTLDVPPVVEDERSFGEPDLVPEPDPE
jgi:hypothetical protein